MHTRRWVTPVLFADRISINFDEPPVPVQAATFFRSLDATPRGSVNFFFLFFPPTTSGGYFSAARSYVTERRTGKRERPAIINRSFVRVVGNDIIDFYRKMIAE